VRFVGRTGTDLPLRGRFAALEAPPGGAVRCIGVFREVPEDGAMEPPFRHAQRLVVVGEVASSVTHDFNNLLTVITGQCDFLRRWIEPDDPVRKHSEAIAKATERAATLARQLLAFSRRRVSKRQVLDIDAVVSQVHAMLRCILGARIDLVTIPHAVTGRVNADPGDIEQIVLNLAVNARDAMPEGGRFSIETKLVELEDRGPHVLLSVDDTGTGMDEETLKSAFQPFFTTKGPGRGTGLGLATVKSLVEQNGGHLAVDSTPGKGTRFSILLPSVEATAELEGEDAGRTEAPRGAAETILLVETEEMLRSLLEQVLGEAGYRVLVAESADAVSGVVAAAEDPVRLLVTDVVMPGRTGRDLARELLADREDLRVLFTSGYGGAPEPLPGLPEQRVGFLYKPFTPASLVTRVRELLDAS
jgi:nitrogen-specific signal transduction histidine kinase